MLIEVMAAGKPIIASRIPPITEIVLDGETGFLIPPDEPKGFAQSTIYLLSHPEEARAMGLKGSRRVQEVFSAEAMARKILTVYERIL